MKIYSKCDKLSCLCLLCPHGCRLKSGETGICGVRSNMGKGRVDLISYGLVSGYAVDPIEKKPLYHFYPGTRILSAGSFGCNMKCDFCQNYSISHEFNLVAGRRISPEEVVTDAMSLRNNTGIAFTYNEPVVWIEFMTAIAEKAAGAGLKTVMISNGYINPSPLNDILPLIDAFNIDLKFFSDRKYREVAGASLKPVLATLSAIAKSGKHLEITTLVIPGLNDTPDEIDRLSSWIASECGRETALHISGYHPSYRRKTVATTSQSIMELCLVAAKNLSYVYAGNRSDLQQSDTYCPQCGTKVTLRDGYSITLQNLDSRGSCILCGKTVYHHFSLPG